MGTRIHAVRRKDGNLSYREWSTTSSTYNTPTLTKEQMIFYLLFDCARSKGFAAIPYVIPHNVVWPLDHVRPYGEAEPTQTALLDRWMRCGEEREYQGTAREFVEDIKKFLRRSLGDIVQAQLELAVKIKEDPSFKSFEEPRERAKDIFEKFSKK